MSWYLALNPVQAVAVCFAAVALVVGLLFAVCALIVARDADDDYRAAEYTRDITRNKTHGGRL